MSVKQVFTISLLSTFGLAAGCGSGNSTTSSASTTASVTPALYVETNSLSGNAVLAYSRNTDGSLTTIGTYPTSGNGEGLPTAPGALPFPIGGATGSVRLSPNGSYLYAVDAGSNDVAAFTVAANGSLSLIGTYPTGGTAPSSISINATGTYLYVMNSGSVPNANNTPGSITGFTVGGSGSLTAISGSTQPLSANAYVDPAEVAFSPDGSYLAVTEKQPGATGTIDIYPVTGGTAGAPVSQPSSGNIPFGFSFTPAGALVVANAESVSTPNAATLSSYTATAAGALTVISSRIPDLQSAACWVALTSTGNYAYTTNTISGSISGYSVSSTGTLALLTTNGITAPQAATTGPIDLAVAPGDSFLYVLNSNAGATPGTIAGFSIGTGGALTAITTNVSGLLPGSVGMAIR